MIEAGVPNYTAFTWNGLLAPSATPREVILTLNAALQKILATPDMASRYAAIGTDIMTGTPESFKQLLQAETLKWRRIIETNGLKAD